MRVARVSRGLQGVETITSGTGGKGRDRSRLALALRLASRQALVKYGLPSTRPLGDMAGFPVVPSAAPSPSQIHCSGSDSPAPSCR